MGLGGNALCTSAHDPNCMPKPSPGIVSPTPTRMPPLRPRPRPPATPTPSTSSPTYASSSRVTVDVGGGGRVIVVPQSPAPVVASVGPDYGPSASSAPYYPGDNADLEVRDRRGAGAGTLERALPWLAIGIGAYLLLTRRSS